MKNFYLKTKKGVRVYKARNIDEAMAKAKADGLIVFRVMTEQEAQEQSVLTNLEDWNKKSEKIGKVRI